MTELLYAAQQAVSYAVTQAVHDGHDSADGQARCDTHQVVGFAMRLSQHPCGAYSTHPPVIVAFQREQWLRIAVMLKGLDR